MSKNRKNFGFAQQKKTKKRGPGSRNSTFKDMEDELEQLQKEYNRLKFKRNSLKSKELTGTLQTRLEAAKARLEKKQKENKELTLEYEALEKRYEELVEENKRDEESKLSEENRNKLRELKDTISNYQKEIEELKEKEMNSEISKKLNESQEKLKKVIEENNDLRKVLEEKKEYLEQLKKEVYEKYCVRPDGDEEKELEDMKKKINEENKLEINKLKETIKSLEVELKNLKKMEDSKSNAAIKERLAAFNMQLKLKMQENQKLEEELKELRNRINLNSEISDTTNYSDATDDEISFTRKKTADSATYSVEISVKDTRTETSSHDEGEKEQEMSEGEMDGEPESSTEESNTSTSSDSASESESETENSSEEEEEEASSEKEGQEEGGEKEEEEEKDFEIRTLEQLFTIPSAVEYFKEFLCEQLNQENILFFLDVKEFKNTYYNDKKIARGAKMIYNKYIKPGSLFEINVDAKTREDIAELMAQKKYSVDMFDKAQEIVFAHMDHNSFEPFKQTKLYEELIKKLKNSVDYSLTSTAKKAVLVSRKREVTALNVDTKFYGKARDANTVGEELMEVLITILNAHYSISSKQIDLNHISQSIPFHRFVTATAELQRVRLGPLNEKQRLAFFINVYNVLLLHTAIVNGLPTDLAGWSKFQTDSKYVIDRQSYSLADIKHGILRANRDPKVYTSPYFKPNDPRASVALTKVNPKIHFALISFTVQISILQVYYTDKVIKLLDEVTRLQLSKQVKMSKKKMYLPSVFQKYIKDFGPSQTQVMAWVGTYFSKHKSNILWKAEENGDIKYIKDTVVIPVFILDSKSILFKKFGKLEIKRD